METRALTLQRLAPERRVLFIGAGALALAAMVSLSQIGAPDYSGLAANREVEMHTARMPASSLTELAKNSDAVVVGRVVGKGNVHFILPEGQQPQGLQPDSRLNGLGKAKDAPGLASAPKRSNDGILTPPKGIPVTDFSVQLTQVLDGKLAPGATITVSQPGGEIKMPPPAGSQAPTLVRTLVAEHDPLLQVGEEQVLFLQQEGNGAFHITSGPDGRFGLDARRALKPLDETTPVGASQKGQTLQELAGKLHSIRSGGLAN
jgi:hypothetical protein